MRALMSSIRSTQSAIRHCVGPLGSLLCLLIGLELVFAQAVPDSDERWDPRFYTSFGCNGAVLAVSQGPGNTVFLGGQFTSCADVPTRYIAAYDTVTKTFSLLDDGLASGMGGEVSALYWTNDRLYVGGLFATAGGISASGIAAWVPDTQTWHALGDGLAHSSAFSFQVRAFELFNNELVVAGSFTQAGGQTANNIAKVTLDLANPIWSVLSDENRQGTQGIVYDLEVIGSELYVASQWTSLGNPAATQIIAKWTGTQWQALANVPSLDTITNIEVLGGDLYVMGPNQLLTRFNLSDGSQTWDTLTGLGQLLLATSQGLYISGMFTNLGSNQARFLAYGERITSGTDAGQINWQPVLGSGGGGVNESPSVLVEVGNQIWLGGSIYQADHLTSNQVVIWDPAINQFQSVGVAGGLGFSNEVRALLFQGTDLYAGGFFQVAGEASAGAVAKLSGAQWQGLGQRNLSPVYSLGWLNDQLYAGGAFQFNTDNLKYLSRYDAQNDVWLTVSGYPNGFVMAMVPFGNQLVMGGEFTQVNGQAQSALASFDGSTWGAVGSSDFNGFLYALASAGNDLYVGGSFTQATSAVNASRVAHFDGEQWRALGAGLNGTVRSLALVAGDLYVGGEFTASGDGALSLGYIARWDGLAWHPVGDGLDQPVYALTTDGTSLYASGEFTESNGQALGQVARWDGIQWQALGQGLSAASYPSSGRALAMGPVGEVYVGGRVIEAGGKVSSYLALYTVPECEPGTFSANGFQPCQPCPVGQFAEFTRSMTCQPCPLGSEPNSGADACQPCPAGRFSPGAGTVCSACPVGQVQPAEGATECVDCLVGEYQDETGQAVCKDCAPGTANNTPGASICATCQPGSFAAEPKQTECLACAVGRFSSSPGASACDLCAPGSFADETGLDQCKLCGLAEISVVFGATGCSDCQAGRQADATRTECVLCPVGQFSDQDGTPCQDCAPGTFSDVEGAQSCPLCPIGTNQPNAGQSACLDCGPGTQGSADRTACADCPAGTFGAVAGQGCLDCQIGQHQPQTGQLACLDCALGQYQDLVGQANCKACPAGRFQDALGQADCKLCGVGSHQPAMGQSECVLCQAGEQGSEDRTSCVDCDLGQFSTGDGQGCLACAPGSIQPLTGQAACVACQPGRFQDLAGQISCNNCPPGRHQDEPGQSDCKLCGAGEYADVPGLSACLSCQPGSFAPSLGSVGCDLCPPGSFSDTPAADACKTCLGDTDTGNSPGAKTCSLGLIFIDRFQQGAWFLPKSNCLDVGQPSKV